MKRRICQMFKYFKYLILLMNSKVFPMKRNEFAKQSNAEVCIRFLYFCFKPRLNIHARTVNLQNQLQM